MELLTREVESQPQRPSFWYDLVPKLEDEVVTIDDVSRLKFVVKGKVATINLNSELGRTENTFQPW